MHITNWMLRYESVASFCWGTKKVTQLSHSVMSNSLRPHGLQHARLPCPSPIPEVYSNSCPLSQWCNPTISSSLQSFPASGSFWMSQFFLSGGQNIGVSASEWKYWSFSFSNEYSGLISFRMDWLNLLADQGTLKSLLQHHSSKASILRHSVFLIVQLSHPYVTTGKTIALTRRTIVGKVGRKQRTKEPLDESETGEWKSWLKTQHSEN